MSYEHPCPTCDDEGYMRPDGTEVPCPACGGTGQNVARNLAAMAEHGIEIGQTRYQGARDTIEVVAPAAHFPRNGKGLVVCRRQRRGCPWTVVTRYRPETLAEFPTTCAT